MQTRTYRLNDDGWSVAGCSIIYAPRGQAGEYAKLATNPYRGCGHKCAYCYVPAVLHISRAVDGHRRDPADFIQRAHERRYLTLRMPAVVARVGYQRRRVCVAMAHDAVAPIFP